METFSDAWSAAALPCPPQPQLLLCPAHWSEVPIADPIFEFSRGLPLSRVMPLPLEQGHACVWHSSGSRAHPHVSARKGGREKKVSAHLHENGANGAGKKAATVSKEDPLHTHSNLLIRRSDFPRSDFRENTASLPHERARAWVSRDSK